VSDPTTEELLKEQIEYLETELKLSRRSDKVLNLLSTIMLSPEYVANFEQAVEASFLMVDLVEERCRREAQ
jgi:hypothetical protein